MPTWTGLSFGLFNFPFYMHIFSFVRARFCDFNEQQAAGAPVPRSCFCLKCMLVHLGPQCSSFSHARRGAGMAGRDRDVCHMCCGVRGRCVAPCPRVRGLRRRHIARLLDEGNVPFGVDPACQLAWEARYRAHMRAERMDQTIAGLEERMRELQAQLAAAHAMRGNADRLEETLRRFAAGGGGAPTPAPRQSQQPESELAASERGD